MSLVIVYTCVNQANLILFCNQWPLVRPTRDTNGPSFRLTGMQEDLEKNSPVELNLDTPDIGRFIIIK